MKAHYLILVFIAPVIFYIGWHGFSGMMNRYRMWKVKRGLRRDR